MDSQFNTLIRSYHDNYLQYKISGNSSYQQSYQLAKEGIETILSTMENENAEKQKNITAFQSQNIEEKIRDIQSQKTANKRKVITQNDQLVSAEMRSKAIETFTQNESSNSGYVLLAIVVIVSGLLMKR